MVQEKIRAMTDADIEQLLSKGESASPLTTLEDVPVEFEDVHILYRVAKQTQFEATAEQGVRTDCSCSISIVFFRFRSSSCCSITPPMIR